MVTNEEFIFISRFGKRQVRFPSGKEKLHCSVRDNREDRERMCTTPERRQLLPELCEKGQVLSYTSFREQVVEASRFREVISNSSKISLTRREFLRHQFRISYRKNIYYFEHGRRCCTFFITTISTYHWNWKESEKYFWSNQWYNTLGEF